MTDINNKDGQHGVMYTGAGYVAEPGSVIPGTPEDQWRPIATAPRDGTDVLVYVEFASVEIVHLAYYNSKEDWEYAGKECSPEDCTEDEYVGWWYFISGHSQEKIEECFEPTHWMPYKAPKGKE